MDMALINAVASLAMSAGPVPDYCRRDEGCDEDRRAHSFSSAERRPAIVSCSEIQSPSSFAAVPVRTYCRGFPQISHRPHSTAL